MQLVIEKVKHQPDSSFAVEHNLLPHFISPWHFHPEVEINLVRQGTGTLFAGDHISKYSPGVLALVGSKLPHVFMSDKEHHKSKTKLMSESVVLKFNEDFLGEGFFEKPEMQRIRTLFHNSSRGMVFTGKTRDILESKILETAMQRDFYKVLSILSILDVMSRSKEFEYLSSKGYSSTFNDADCDRIDKVYKYVMEHFTRDIPLEEIADVANLCPTAFCRYFKTRTLKTFSHFVNEIRIGYACKLLMEKKYTISEVSYRSGFNYLSNFFKQFRHIMKMTPQEYQKKYWNNLS